MQAPAPRSEAAFADALVDDFESLVTKTCTVDVETATAREPGDEANIKRTIREAMGGFEAVNKTVIGSLRAWMAGAGRAALRVRNDSAGEIRLSFRAQAHPGEGERALRVTLGERLLWGGQLAVRGATELRFGAVLPPGESILVFATDLPPQRKGSDPRALAFRLSDVELIATP